MASLDWTSWSFLPSADVAMCRRGEWANAYSAEMLGGVKLLSGGLPHTSTSVSAEKERKKIHPSVSWKKNFLRFSLLSISQGNPKKKKGNNSWRNFFPFFLLTTDEMFFLPPWWRVIYYFRSICDSSALASLFSYTFSIIIEGRNHRRKMLELCLCGC